MLNQIPTRPWFKPQLGGHLVCWLEPSVQVWVSKNQTGIRSDFWNWFWKLDLVQFWVSKNQTGIRSDFWNWVWDGIWFSFGLVKTKLESGLIFGTGFGTGSGSVLG